MKKNLSFLLAVLWCCVLCSPVVLASSSSHRTSFEREGKTIYVDQANINGPWDGTLEHPYRFIADGINASEDTDTVFVFNGTYHEVMSIDTSIMLIGDATTILDGMSHDNILTIHADFVQVHNFIIRNSSGGHEGVGIRLSSSDVVIKNCTISRTKIGIFVDHGSRSDINNCTLHNNGIGISLYFSEQIRIEGCTFGRNSIGISGDAARASSISFSYFHTNGHACFLKNSHDITFVHSNISDNIVNHGGLFLRGCTTITIEDCRLLHNGAAVSIGGSSFIAIRNSTLQCNTLYAVWIEQHSNNITVEQCDITDNLRFGVYIIGDSSSSVHSNNIKNNYLFGLYTKQSSCRAQENYWGSPLGPSRTDFGRGDRIRLPLHFSDYFPWKLTPIDNSGARWANQEPYLNRMTDDTTPSMINLPGNDSDNDTVPDWWEVKWEYNPNIWDDHIHLDPDGDGLTNVQECYTDSWGSNPFRQDLFLEIDWMKPQDSQQTNKPSEALLETLRATFAARNITLHVDIGALGGGEELPIRSQFSFTDLCDIYWDYFLHQDLNNPRKGIFHYGVICDTGPDSNFPFMGWNQLDSLLVSAQTLQESFPSFSRDRLIVGGLIHHLGHTLGLLADTYDGIDNLGTLMPFSLQWFTYLPYKSCMNYFYKFTTLSFSDGTYGARDFDDWSHLNLSFFKKSSFLR